VLTLTDCCRGGRPSDVEIRGTDAGGTIIISVCSLRKGFHRMDIWKLKLEGLGSLCLMAFLSLRGEGIILGRPPCSLAMRELL
jgi:hypothetical protein